MEDYTDLNIKKIIANINLTNEILSSSILLFDSSLYVIDEADLLDGSDCLFGSDNNDDYDYDYDDYVPGSDDYFNIYGTARVNRIETARQILFEKPILSRKPINFNLFEQKAHWYGQKMCWLYIVNDDLLGVVPSVRINYVRERQNNTKVYKNISLFLRSIKKNEPGKITLAPKYCIQAIANYYLRELSRNCYGLIHFENSLFVQRRLYKFLSLLSQCRSQAVFQYLRQPALSWKKIKYALSLNNLLAKNSMIKALKNWRLDLQLADRLLISNNNNSILGNLRIRIDNQSSLYIIFLKTISIIFFNKKMYFIKKLKTRIKYNNNISKFKFSKLRSKKTLTWGKDMCRNLNEQPKIILKDTIPIQKSSNSIKIEEQNTKDLLRENLKTTDKHNIDYKKVIEEYYNLSVSSKLSNLDFERMDDILRMAEYDEFLSLLLNEIDYKVGQDLILLEEEKEKFYDKKQARLVEFLNV